MTRKYNSLSQSHLPQLKITYQPIPDHQTLTSPKILTAVLQPCSEPKWPWNERHRPRCTVNYAPCIGGNVLITFYLSDHLTKNFSLYAITGKHLFMTSDTVVVEIEYHVYQCNQNTVFHTDISKCGHAVTYKLDHPQQSLTFWNACIKRGRIVTVQFMYIKLWTADILLQFMVLLF